VLTIEEAESLFLNLFNEAVKIQIFSSL